MAKLKYAAEDIFILHILPACEDMLVAMSCREALAGSEVRTVSQCVVREEREGWKRHGHSKTNAVIRREGWRKVYLEVRLSLESPGAVRPTRVWITR